MSGKQRRKRAPRVRCTVCDKRVETRTDGSPVTHRLAGGRVCVGSHRIAAALDAFGSGEGDTT